MILIKGVHVFAPQDMGIKDVLVGGTKILKIGDNLPAEEAYGVEVIDGTGKILMPGLIDAHVHILGGGGEGGYRTRTPELMLSDALEGGVTTIVGCLGTDGTTRTMTNLIAKARGLEEEGISTYIYTGSYQVPVRTLTGNVMDDLILIDKAVGTGEIAISDHRSSQPSREEFAKIVADTRVGGILSGKAGLVNIHLGDGKEQLSYLSDLSHALGNYQRGDYVSTVATFTKAVENGHKDISIYAAICYENQKSYDKMKEYLDIYANYHGIDAYVNYKYASYYYDTKDYNQALTYLAQGESAGDSDYLQEILYAEIMCYKELQNYTEAFSRATSYIAKYPEDQKGQDLYAYLDTRVNVNEVPVNDRYHLYSEPENSSAVE